MKITLFRDLPNERWHSMERYADELTHHLQGIAPDSAIGAYVLPMPFATSGKLGRLITLAWRTVAYPLAARRQQGELNHVIDHSYAHLLHHLDPRRTVVTCHDLAPLALRPANARRGLSLRLWDWSFAGLRKAAHIICDSQFTANELRRFCDYPIEKISVIHLGVDKAFQIIHDQQKLITFRQHHHLPAQTPILLHVGNCGPRKNVECILQALVHLRQQSMAVHFVQIGGRFTAEQLAFINQHQLQPSITQINFVPEHELPVWYNLADIFVFPSIYEGFGLPVLEALACGTPVICSQAGSLPEIVGDAALTCAPHDHHQFSMHIARLLVEHNLHQDFAQRGLIRVQQFTWERCAHATHAIYLKVRSEQRSNLLPAH